MEHKHIYDKDGKQICCSLEDKINNDSEHHSDGDGHDHDHSNQEKSTFQMFLPAIMSLVLLMFAIGLDNYFTPSWFTGYIRIGWYILAYIPVGFPVIKMHLKASKGRYFFRISINEYCYNWCFCNCRISRRCSSNVILCHWRNLSSISRKRAKANIKTLLDQRPDEVTILENNVAKTIKASNAKIGDIIQLKAGEKLGLDGELLSDTASFNTAALTGESKPDKKQKAKLF